MITESAKKDIYEEWRSYQNELILLRPIVQSDAEALFQTYSDKKSWEFFNCDNFLFPCYLEKMEHMEETVSYYMKAYSIHEFIRWTIVHKKDGKIIGTIENFHRDVRNERGDHTNALTDTALLRIDLKSEYETEEVISSILDLVEDTAYEDFHCSFLATKAVDTALVRRKVLTEKGYVRAENIAPLQDYYVRTNITKEQVKNAVPCGGECTGCGHYAKDCEGCRKTDGKVAMWDSGCEIYRCAKEHNAYICGLCNEFPCNWLRSQVTRWDKEGINTLWKLALASRIHEAQKNLSV